MKCNICEKDIRAGDALCFAEDGKYVHLYCWALERDGQDIDDFDF